MDFVQIFNVILGSLVYLFFLVLDLIGAELLVCVYPGGGGRALPYKPIRDVPKYKPIREIPKQVMTICSRTICYCLQEQ